MSLTNPNTPISQQDLQDFYHKLLPYMSGGESYTAGDGIEISNDVISTDNLQSGDMDDIVTPIPSIPARVPHKYSTTEQIVGEWIDGSPVYERTITKASLSVGDNRIDYSIPNFGRFIEGYGSALRGGTKYVPITHVGATQTGLGWALAFNDIDGTGLYVEVGSGYTSSYVLTDCAITIRYTKTT